MSELESNYTLDKLFSNQIDSFRKEEASVIEKTKAKISLLESKIQTCNNEEKIKKYKAKLESLKNKISHSHKKMNKYLLTNSEQLFDYFVTKQNIEKNNNPKKALDNFFSKSKKEDYISHSKCSQNMKEYLKENNFEVYIENYHYYNNNNDECEMCSICNEGELIKSIYDGILICNKCFSIDKYLIHNDKPAYKEPPKEISFYAYRRINHFKEILAQFQAKESTDIPDSVIENIKNQIKKERIELNKLTSKRTKEILKKLGYNKYYEHITFIKDKLGIKPPIMSQQLEETLCNLFIDIQVPYAKYCPSDRVNFLNYYYTLYKLCELLDEREYLPHFPMLKDQKKIEQDQIWKNICQDLGWDFIPTL
jgi:ribosome-binding protein aMBF1 (putative translation factor)